MQSDSASRRYRQSAKKDNLGNSVLFIQYLNPGAYPPLEHASDALADAGRNCILLGTHSQDTAKLELPPRARRQTLIQGGVARFLPGWAKYLHFVLWATLHGTRKDNGWIYCSDARSAPIGLALRLLRNNIIYHEHDAPSPVARSLRDRFILACRRSLVKKVPCVAPSSGRAKILRELGATRVLVVENYPSRREIGDCADKMQSSQGNNIVLYQGSIVPERLPLAIIHALAKIPSHSRPTLEIVGYETPSGYGHVDAMIGLAQTLGIPESVRYVGAIPCRAMMLQRGTGARAGLSLMPINQGDINMKTMAGASNKPFDYLCQGATPICSDLDEWRDFFGGAAIYCDPRCPDSIAEALSKATDRRGDAPDKRRIQRDLLDSTWNYETAFAPVLAMITNPPTGK